MDAYEECKKTVEHGDSVTKKWKKLTEDEKYENIRESKTDVDSIEQNTGYKKENVQHCKDHVFYDTHILDRYKDYGHNDEIKRFDADDNQAEAWKRLEEGTYIEADLTWLQHEKAEQWYEKKNNAGYSESHDRAQKHWSGDPWTNTENINDDAEDINEV